MLGNEDFGTWCHRLDLSEDGCRVIEQIRQTDPSRRVGGGKKNVSGRYPSKKMVQTIQFESHKVELPFIYQLEHDENILEFYDQPPQIKLSYPSANERNLSFFYTPDFFVIEKETAGWVECKTEDGLQKLQEKNPNRYFLGDDNQWHCPPGEKYAEQFGCYFRVWSDAEVDWTLQRNFLFLEDYFYNASPAEEATANTILSLVSAQPGITLAQLLDHARGSTADDIYFLIAREQIYIDLSAAPLAESSRCFVFSDQQTALAYKATVLSQASVDSIASPIIDLIPGSSLCWNGKSLTIILVGETEILLNDENGQPVELERSTFDYLLRQGKISGLRNQMRGVLSSEAMEFIRKASEGDLKEANRRYKLIEGFLQGEKCKDHTVPERTLRQWRTKYRQAEKQYGYGYIGLLPKLSASGNRNPKLPAYLLEQIEIFIEDQYETHKQKRKLEVYGVFVDACLKAGVPLDQIPSYKTFIKAIKRRSGYEQTTKREGRRAAYSQEPFFLELTITTPRHGDRPFEIGHIDHTQLDIELRCSSTGRLLGRPWATFLVDANTRRILAVYVTFDAPSYRSCMMVLRICVKRHGRLPQIIVTDNGAEFHSIYFETLLALFSCAQKYRPAAKARFNAVGERLFGTSATQLIHNLAGNTQIMKKVRLVTKSVNPKNLALWTLGLLYMYLCEWAYEVYDTTEHPALGQSPREAFATGIAQYGSRSHRVIPYDINFQILTLPTTREGRAKVQPNLGVKINHIYYWSNDFRDPEIEKSWVEIRYDPFDAGIAYAFVRGRWVECYGEHFAKFQGKSEKEIYLASAELRRRNQNHSKNFKLRASHLGAFLSSAESQEELLAQQLRDAQSKEVFSIIDGGTPNRNPFTPQQPEQASSTGRDRTSDTKPQAPPPSALQPDQLIMYEEF
ncbi:TnsA endonuclease N-terminal domain-containing protein [Stenomitos frigidus]|uniref:Integrase n=1 Tax=Stenomitos frigidus ULC18 TaxID=2107698 RepID=A0A2T1EE36_9CYAN|nr:TnsA endonuclease N-terminal domain-containing protein [Stenomitos frigidus]PSB31016.1 integrase [Stenomitos frigidus ULC18]